jgi:hypothetical protein
MIINLDNNNFDNLTNLHHLNSITYQYQNQSFIFNITYNKNISLVSNIQSKNCNPGPMLDIVFSLDGNTGKLNYIRSVKPYKFNILFSLCKRLIQYYKIKYVTLTDNSIYYNNLCIGYPTLTFRIFINKTSIYIDKNELKNNLGFQPIYNNTILIKNNNDYLQAIEELSKTKYIIWKPFIKLIYNKYKNEMDKDIFQEPNENILFGEYLMKCYQENKYIILSKILNNITANRYIKLIPKEYIYFYQLVRDIYKATEIIYIKN